MGKTDGVLAVRRAEYAYAIEDCALPAIQLARGIGCTTGTQLAEFLNAVGVAPYKERKWTKNSANRAILLLLKKKLIVWHRHRGKRNPAQEEMRLALFEAAVKLCRETEGYSQAEQTAT